ncbi:MAG: 3-hydroxybutyryl-CoA dehydrogenase [Acidobacteria bacterium]|nr:MAG: 3-hydroxybutyryl-CoA dehydrogenase [Acidobacteriota bacterium]
MNVKRIGIVGSGIMGSGISEVCAKAGYEVVLRSRTQEKAAATLAAIEKSLAKQVERGKLEEAEREKALAAIKAVSNIKELSDCDIVIESVIEDLDTKRELFAHLDDVCRDDAIIATNTSTLPVIEMASVVRNPERVLGIHFFNPAPVMGLVEVVAALTTSEEAVETARMFAESCGKEPVIVKDQAGFIVNALLFPYLNNAIKLFENGVASMEDIDTAMKAGCGFPMGPLALLDLVGLDTSLSILEALYDEFRDPNYAPAPTLRRLVSAGKLGRKSGSGFFDYQG